MKFKDVKNYTQFGWDDVSQVSLVDAPGNGHVLQLSIYSLKADLINI